MLEAGGPPPASTVTHIDRCLSCLACTTTCPSGVDYGQLIDHARAHIETHYVRPWPERILRALIPAVLTRPRRLAAALALGRLARPLEPLLVRLRLAPLAALLRLVPPSAARRLPHLPRAPQPPDSACPTPDTSAHSVPWSWPESSCWPSGSPAPWVAGWSR